MNRTVCIAWAILLAAAVPAPSFAQVVLNWGLHGNAAKLDTKDALSNVYGWGYGGGAHVDIDLLTAAVRFSGDFTMSKPDAEVYRSELVKIFGGDAAGYTVDGGEVNIFSATVNVKWPVVVFPVVKPYLIGGIGLTQLSSTTMTVNYEGAPVAGVPQGPGESNMSLNLGAGIDLVLGPAVTLFIEGRYSWINTEGSMTGYIPVSFGITF
jgi:opacity protein-like surface antigen